MVIYITSVGKSEDIRRFLSAETRIQVNAIDVRYIDTLPRNDNGKISYSKLTN